MKSLTSLLLATTFSLSALPAMALSDQEIAETCKQAGIEKITTQAEIWSCEINAKDIKVADIDNRFYNPSKYIWYSVETTCEDSPRTSITKMVQYNNGECL